MAKKKVMLFIVEGPTDETSLSTVLNRIFSSSTVKFQVFSADVTGMSVFLSFLEALSSPKAA